MIRSDALIAAAALLCAASGAASAAEDICTPGYARARRLPPAAYYPLAQAVFAAHGVAWTDRHDYELDHIVPLCLGGSNDAANLAPQPLAEARQKDRLEWFACRAVCAGRTTLPEARGWFADWRASFRRIFGETPCRIFGETP